MNQREATLDEWVERLPEIHSARKEYDALKLMVKDLAEHKEPSLPCVTCEICNVSTPFVKTETGYRCIRHIDVQQPCATPAEGTQLTDKQQLGQALDLVRHNMDLLPANYNTIYFERGLDFIEQQATDPKNKESTKAGNSFFSMTHEEIVDIVQFLFQDHSLLFREEKVLQVEAKFNNNLMEPGPRSI